MYEALKSGNGESKIMTARRSAQWRKKFEERRALHRQIRQEAMDILSSPNFCATRRHIQHGNVTVKEHCINVAIISLMISRKLQLSCSRRELIRGALLHDYFLYDWHDREHISPHKLHGFYHPGRALRNAAKEYELTHREKEIIVKHMWPLTVLPPTCREAWIVTTADKWCSLMETFRLYKGHGKALDSASQPS